MADHADATAIYCEPDIPKFVRCDMLDHGIISLSQVKKLYLPDPFDPFVISIPGLYNKKLRRFCSYPKLASKFSNCIYKGLISIFRRRRQRYML
ncbi:hypothetical protein D3C87_1073290 [compost metagenome]